MLPTTFRFIWPSGFRVEDFLGIDQSATRIVCAGHVCLRIQNEQSVATYQVSVHMGKRFQRRRFLEINQSETRISMAAMFAKGSGLNEQYL